LRALGSINAPYAGLAVTQTTSPSTSRSSQRCSPAPCPRGDRTRGVLTGVAEKLTGQCLRCDTHDLQPVRIDTLRVLRMLERLGGEIRLDTDVSCILVARLRPCSAKPDRCRVSRPLNRGDDSRTPHPMSVGFACSALTPSRRPWSSRSRSRRRLPSSCRRPELCSTQAVVSRRMLAYVFWHRPADGVDGALYEDALRRFHESLHRPSASFRLQELPFAGVDGYEDWYLIEDWRGLGALNADAVDSERGPSHQAVANLAASGWGGVYALVVGTVEPPSGTRWLSKPSGQSYDEFVGSLEGKTVWQRQLVLGPAPEFCVGEEKSAGRKRIF
jgi:hypothetical protein